MSLKASSLQEPIIKYRTMNGILSEKSKSLAFTGHRTVPVERQDEIRAASLKPCRLHAGQALPASTQAWPWDST